MQALPLTWVARLGRAGGALAFRLDVRHRRVALKNLTMCFGQEKSAAEIRALAKENFRRIGENYSCAVKTAAMTLGADAPHFEFVGAEKILPHEANQARKAGSWPSAISATSSFTRASASSCPCSSAPPRIAACASPRSTG